MTFRKMDEAMQHLQSNPFYGKYAQKIDKIKKERPVELVKAVQTRKSEAKNEAADAVVGAAGVKPISSKAPKGKTTLPSGAYAFAPPKKLDSIMKTELLRYKNAEEVTFLWNQHWQNFPVISGVMKGQLYDSIRATATTYDKFLFALPREQGYEFILAQFAGPEVHFTPLINYQAYQENAPECLTMVHYTELQESLDIVLMRGEYDTNTLEAQFLANQVQLYYSGVEPSKTALLKLFHEQPQNFSHMDLVKEFDKLDLSALQLKAPKN
ncbi:hypothetical protein HAZT_HAZT003066 [Hyalella azteca]|uniref:ATP synthase mitochondrial F1 complex assembly factor 1 n=1 Tax=Hyalella azteca TaxID=294128 RepID=A0A6A0H714_HYAAZ|nr:hypothetical protein HAZT_HAZT003066 [Hyalella azteca]